jgi:hypothetical protein
MPNSIISGRNLPTWPLGAVIVLTPGTPVRATFIIDPTNANAPETPTSATSAEYTFRFNQMLFSGYRNDGTKWVRNTGNVYVIQKGDGTGSANRADAGVLVAVVEPGQTFTLGAAAMNRDVFSPYQYYIDADTANDACAIVGIVQ